MMNSTSLNNSHCGSCDSTPSFIYSPLPIRTPRILAFSVKLSNESLAEFDDLNSRNGKPRDAANNSNKKIYKKFLDLAKEDLDSEPRYFIVTQ